MAEPDELAHHEKVLAGIDKESKGQCLWLPKPPPRKCRRPEHRNPPAAPIPSADAPGDRGIHRPGLGAEEPQPLRNTLNAGPK